MAITGSPTRTLSESPSGGAELLLRRGWLVQSAASCSARAVAGQVAAAVASASAAASAVAAGGAVDIAPKLSASAGRCVGRPLGGADQPAQVAPVVVRQLLLGGAPVGGGRGGGSGRGRRPDAAAHAVHQRLRRL